MTQSTGHFYGIGVGVQPEMLSVSAWKALQQADIIYAPRSKVSGESVALAMLGDLPYDRAKVRDIEFTMDGRSERLETFYRDLAAEIVREVQAGRRVAYLTIGDSLTFSTYAYLLDELRQQAPQLPRTTFAGVNSFAAAASALEFVLSEEKEQLLVLPCPNDMEELRAALRSHQVVALMKIGKRFGAVLEVLREMNLLGSAALASRIGLPDQVLLPSLEHFDGDERLGYLSVMLIRTHNERRFGA